MEYQSSMPADWMEDALAQHGDRLYRLALAIVGNVAEAEDIVQDAFVKLVEKNPRFESSEHETAWLTRVTVNLCKDRLRSHRWKKTVALLDFYPAENDEESGLLDAVSSLPTKYRTVIHLFYYEGYSLKEIAELLELNEATVRQQHSRARKTLENLLKGESK